MSVSREDSKYAEFCRASSWKIIRYLQSYTSVDEIIVIILYRK